MSIAPATDARDRVFAVLNDLAGLALLVGDRIYPARPAPGAQKPFVRVGVPTIVPDVQSGWRTGVASIAVHFFVDQSEAFPDPETTCGDAVSLMADALDENPRIIVTRTQVLLDRNEPEQAHGIVFVEVTPPAS